MAIHNNLILGPVYPTAAMTWLTLTFVFVFTRTKLLWPLG
jgi:hypothetical protein